MNKKRLRILSIFLLFAMFIGILPLTSGYSMNGIKNEDNIEVASDGQSLNGGVEATYNPSPQGGSSNCYDGVCFEGEIEGNKLITYQDMVSETGIGGSDISISQDRLGKSNDLKEINRLYQEELSKGGMYLKFIDNKYKDANSKSRIFYVSKKPLKRHVSYNMLFDKGLIYGWDVINPDGTVKPNMGVPDTYKPFIKEINGTKYIARLLRGRSNYGAHIVNYDTSELNSEWNRTMLPITRGYRFSRDTFNDLYAESILRYTDAVEWPTVDPYRLNKTDKNYDVQTAQYNWFGDLTLGSSEPWNYSNKIVNSVGYLGQQNLTQDTIGEKYASARGSGEEWRGEAYSAKVFKSTTFESSWRLVLEPLIED